MISSISTGCRPRSTWPSCLLSIPRPGARPAASASSPSSFAPGRRSRSATGGFAALGARAEWLPAGQTLNDYYGFESPLDRLCQARGKVLLLGSNPANVTLLHFAEYRAQLPDKRTERHPEVVLVDGKRTILEVTALDCSAGIVDWPGEDYFGIR